MEEKLGSDVSLSASYDPERNQTARNVDCVLDICGSRRPAFWMFERGPRRITRPLNRALPHRAEALFPVLCADLTVVTWADLLKLRWGRRIGVAAASDRRELGERD